MISFCDAFSNSNSIAVYTCLHRHHHRHYNHNHHHRHRHQGIVRVESLEDACAYIPTVVRRVKREYLERTYAVELPPLPSPQLGNDY